MFEVILERVGDEGEDFLILIEEEHGAQVSQSLVRKSGRGQQFEAFYLAEVGSLAEGEEVEQLCNIIPPYVGVVAVLPETGPDGCTLFLHHRSFVGDGLGGPHIADELLDYRLVSIELDDRGHTPYGNSSCAGRGFEGEMVQPQSVMMEGKRKIIQGYHISPLPCFSPSTV